MVAVVSGNGLGLFNTSLTALGGTAGGAAGIGQGRDAQYVNVATGNLVLQDRDEALSVRGFNAAFLRTYNSRGTLGEVGQDGWATGYERNLVLGGTINTTGSTMTLATGDGQTQVFAYTGTANNYRSTAGDGAHDTLVWNGTAKTWTLTEGSSRREELYADHASATLKGRLTRIRDLKSDGTTPAQFDIVYDSNNRVWEVRSIDGAAAASRDALVFTYQGTTTQLTSVLTREGGTLKGQVWYEYDAQGRLNKVTTDLTPDTTTSTTVAPARTGDNAWNATAALNNGKLFQTTYAYVTTTASDLRIASVTQSDGTVTSYTYDASSRISTVTLGSGADAQTTTFTYGTGTTDVTMTVDGVARTWTYQYDANKQLTAVLAPATSGQRDTTNYTYDATTGDVLSVIVTRSGTVVSQSNNIYDASGNLTWQWTRIAGGTPSSSASATAVQRTYNSANQVLTETRFPVDDSDGPAGTLMTGGLKTQFIYDARNRLRFLVDATGVVTERVYATTGNGIGQVASERRYAATVYTGTMTESALTTWATATQKAGSQLTDYTYDAKGRLAQANAFATVDSAGAGVLDAATDVTRYTYDTQGLLRQQIVVRGTGRTLAGGPLAGSELTDYVYDGLGRLLSVLTRDTGSAANDDTLTVATTYAYTDSARQIVTTMDSGATLTRTQTTAGQTKTSVLAGAGMTSRTSTNYYNAAGELRASEDAAGGRRYFFYDAKGRLEAEVDATGAVVQYAYDGADRRLGSVAYANGVNTTTWVSAGAVVKNLFTDIGVVADAAKDRVTTRTYDAVGRLLTETDGAAGNTDRQITNYTYDGASRVTTIVTTDSAGANGRTQRFLYDAAGRQVAAVDAQNYVTETIYDAAGRVSSTIRYANATAAPTATTIAALRPTLNATNDQTTRLYYNGRGQLVGSLDAEGYLTEVIVDAAGNNRTERRYAKAVVWAANDTLALLRTKAMTSPPTEPYQDSRQQWNGLGQLATQTNAEGTVSKFYYDEAGRLVRTELAANTTDVRDNYARYNVFGELVGEMSGEQVARLATDNRLLGKLLTDPSLTATQLDDAYGSFGTTHALDAVGRRIESTDAQGNKVFYFYDLQGRQTFAVRGIANGATKNFHGEVTETRYTAFGDIQDTTVYTGRITIAGQNRAGVQTAIGALTFSASLDSRRALTYTARGLVATQTDAMGVVSSYTYNAFGQVSREVRAQATAAAVTIDHVYNARGLETSRVEGVGLGIARTLGTAYDAFGRAITATDARNSATNFVYDRLGRQVTRTQSVVSEGAARNEKWETTYDAYGRVLTLKDPNNATTTYKHSDTARSVEVTSPEGLKITTVHNRFGQTLTITDPLGGVTTNTYDDSGNLRSTTRPGVASSYTWNYDTLDQLVGTTDEAGRTVAYTYDAARRVLTRTVAPGTLNLTTTNEYDAQGRQLKVTDASGRVTTMSYDREGRLLQTAQDPAGLNLRTSYTWDALGRQLTVVEGTGTAVATTTQYIYDALGRRTSEIRDAGAGRLNLTTTYLYDANDNVVQRTDATGRITRFVYDEANRLTHTVDAGGGVSKSVYDANGQVTQVRQYATAITVSDLSTTAAVPVATIKTRIDTIANAAKDVVEYRAYTPDGRLLRQTDALGNITRFVYDAGGRLTYTIDATGGYSRNWFDAAGQLCTTRRFVARFDVATLSDATTVAQLDALLVWQPEDAAEYYVRDGVGNIRYVINTHSEIAESIYDGAGRRVAEKRYANNLALDSALQNKLFAGTAVPGDIVAPAPSANDQMDRYVYDGANRLRYVIDAAGAVTENLFDGAGRIVETRRYPTAVVLAGQPAEAQVAAAISNPAPYAWSTEFGSPSIPGMDTSGLLNAQITGDHIVFQGLNQATVQYPVAYSTGAHTLAEKLTYRTEVRTGLSLANMKFTLGLENGQAWGTAVFQRQAIYIDGDKLYANETDGASNTTRELMTLAADTTYVVEQVTADGQITTYVYAKGSERANGVSFSRAISSQTWGNVRWMAAGYNGPGWNSAAFYVENLSISAAPTLPRETFTYDEAGRVTGKTDALGNIETYTYDAAGRRTAVTDARGYTSYAVYDAAGRVRLSIDSLGQVQQTLYDAAGRAYATRGYATTVTVDATLAAQLRAGTSALAAPAANDAADSRSYRVFDAAGRVRFVVDAANAVQEMRYDANGRVVESLAYATALADATLITNIKAGTASEAGFATFVSTNAAGARASYNVYDSAGRVLYTVMRGDSATIGLVSEWRYNGLGQVVAEVHYAKTVLYTPAQTAAQLAAAINTAGGNDAANQRLTRIVYDADGHERYRIDDANAVTEQRYNALGQVVETRTYAAAATISAFTLAGVASAVSALSFRYATFAYDLAGRLTSTTNALGKTESYGYDALGQRTSLSNRLGQTWTYAYDAAGRLVEERSPQVMVARYNAVGVLQAPTLEAIVTRMDYDALGNVISRTEAFGTVDARMTRYVYDSRGNQIKTLFPNAGRYNEADGRIITSDTVAPDTRITYDALGRAAVQKDVRGNLSYKVYNALGQVAFDIDAEGYVTGYTYNAYGEQTGLRRYATPANLALASGWTSGTPLSLAQASLAGVITAQPTLDRVLTTSYDLRGNKLSVVQPAVSYVNSFGDVGTTSPVTNFEYDAYGNLVKESVLLEQALNGHPARWATTFHYYDELGRREMSVDAEGYVTTWTYNVLGEVAQQKQYARALNTAGLSSGTRPSTPVAGDSTTGMDRVTSFVYDALGRKTSETTARMFQRSDGSGGVRSVINGYTYDDADHVTRVTVDGVGTDTAYDALGRATSVTEEARQVLVDNWQTQVIDGAEKNLGTSTLYTSAAPYTAMTYDAFGNVVRVLRSAQGVRNGTVTPTAADQVSTTRYDYQGRAVVTVDAMGKRTSAIYDAADNVIQQLYWVAGNNNESAGIVSLFSYDKANRQTVSEANRVRHQVINGTLTYINTVVDRREVVRYNAFGEVIAKANDAAQLDNVAQSAQYEYDLAGRLVRSNADGGAYRSYGFNLAGHQQTETRDWTDGTTPRSAIYSQATDRLGRAVRTTTPSYGLDNALSATTTLRLDRWGNVLEQIDARGYSTQLFYNDQDKVIRQVAPLVKVLSDTGVETWIRPETRWMYDVVGRLVAQTDANGHTRKYEYNTAGQLLRSIDANGQATRQAYDTFGQAVASENALGYLTYVNYDAMGRAVEQGDFLPDLEGDQRVRTAQQRYSLDGNGNRITVTDALNNVQRYDYDSEGRLLRSETPTNISRDGNGNAVAPGTSVVMTYAYDVQGRKTLDQNAYANLTWTYDYFGRATAHKDLGNVTSTYAYDSRSGLQTGVTQSNGATRVITYNANGSVRRVTEGTNVYAYEYDSVGNRISEETLAVDGQGKLVHVATYTSYDSNNRIARIASDDVVNTVRMLDLRYDYDAVGNRRRVIADTSYGPGALPVSMANQAPYVIAPPADASIKINTTRTWTLRASDIFRDPENTALAYSLAVNGAGTLPTWLTMTYSAQTGLLTFTATNAPTAGEINNLKIVATDAGGVSTFAAYKFTSVTNTAPVALDASTPQIVMRTGREFSSDLRVTDFFRDADIGDTLSLTVSAGLPGWLSASALEAGVLRLVGTPPGTGSYTLTLRAQDENGAFVTRAVQVTVEAAAPPQAVAGVTPLTMVADRNASLSLNLDTLFLATNGDDIALTATMDNDDALPSWLSFQYLSSQTPATVKFFGRAPLGTPDGTVFHLKLVATDSDGASVPKYVNITVTQNHAPTLLSTVGTQNARVLEPFSVTISLAGRFTDVDGDAWVQTFANTDPRASWLSASFDVGNNTVTLTGTPPDNSKSGDYSVGIRATDTSGASVILPINLHVVGRNAPTYTASSIVPPTAYSSVAYSYQIPANAFVDIDGDALTFTAVQIVTVIDYEFVEGAHPPMQPSGSHEEDQPLPSWLNFNAATGTFSGTPPTTQTVRLKIVATESEAAGGGSATALFNITVLAAPNYPPTVNAGIPNQNATPTVPASGWSYAFPANAFADADALTYSIVSGMPGWMSFTPGTRTFSGTPSTPGSWTITVRATDTIGQTVQTSFVVTTPNVAPVVTAGIGTQGNTVNTPWNFTFAANTFADGNNQALTYSATGMPAGINFDAATRTFSGTPTAIGNYAITVTASDGTLTASTSFTYSVNAYVNQAPVYLGLLDDAFGGSQQAFSYTVSASAFNDPYGDTLTYSVSGLPSGLSFNPGTMQVTGTLPRFRYDYETDFTVTVTDPGGLTASGNVHCYMSGWGGPMGGFLMAGGGEFESQAMIIDPGEGGGGPGGGGGPVATGWGNPTQPGSTPNRQELWFTYDGENRAVVINGKLEGGVIKVSGDKSWSQTYDAVGNVVGKITLVAGVTQLAQSGYTLRKELQSESYAAAVGTDKGLQKTYIYDNAGRLGETREYYALGTTKQVIVREADGTRYPVSVDVGGWLRRAETYTYEADGSLRVIDEFARVQGWAGAYADTGNGALDAAAILAQKTNTAVLSKISAQAYYGADFRSTYDLAGRVDKNYYHHENNAEGSGSAGNNGAFITTYQHTYVGGEGWLETQVTGDVNVANYRDSSMTSRYDAWGRRVEMTETTPLPDYQTTLTYKRYFSYDLEGGILSRRDGDWRNNTFSQIPDVNTPVVNLAPDFISNAQWTAMTDAQRRSWMAAGQNQRFVYSNGQQVARLNEAGKLDVTTAMTAFDSSSLGSSMVAVNDGDTLQSIAQRTYGNASLWYILAEANAVTDSQLFTGQMLKAPDVTTNKNDSTTFKPYNPAEIMGPTEPGTPYIAAPPKAGGNNCAMMIVMIVAVVVTAIVAPYLTKLVADAMLALGAASVAAGTVAGVAAAAIGGFAGGMAGSIASQVVGKALGVVDHFSLRSAVSSGIATGITAGLAAGFSGGATAGVSVGDKAFSGATVGGALRDQAWGRAAALAVGNAASGYVGNKISGIQGTTFSWKSIAAGAVGSVITSGITNKMGLGEDKLFKGFGKVGADLAGGMIGSVVSLHVRRAAGFDDKVDYRQISMDVFGNALGNAAVRGMQNYSANKSKADWAADQGSFLDRYPDATASGYGGQKGILEGVPGTMPTDGNAMDGAAAYSCSITDPKFASDPANQDNMLTQMAIDAKLIRDAQNYLRSNTITDEQSVTAANVAWQDAANTPTNQFVLAKVDKSHELVTEMMVNNAWSQCAMQALPRTATLAPVIVSGTAGDGSSNPLAHTDSAPSFSGLWGAGLAWGAQGRSLLIDHPILIKQWESTRSAWTGKSGFTAPATIMLQRQGIVVNPLINPTPAGSLSRKSGVPSSVANNINGSLAEVAIADRYRNQGYDVAVRQARRDGTRIVDVVVELPAMDPRFSTRLEIESKVGRAGDQAFYRTQAANDAADLIENKAFRTTGRVLQGVGRVARPVGIVMDALQVRNAYAADGGHVGENTGRAVSGIAGGAAGGWGGAAGGAWAGAAIGTFFFPGVGTAIGGGVGAIVGGIGGSWGGTELGQASFNYASKPR